MRTYLDHSASTPVSKRALRAYLHAMKKYGNPSAAHTEGREALALLTDARTRIARLAGVKADGVIFTSGATEANNLAIKGFVAGLTTKPHILYADGAHASIVEPITSLIRYGATADVIPFTDGALDLGAMTALLRPETALVVVERVASETGCITNTREVRRVLDKHGAGRVMLHVDASQGPCIDTIERTHLGADYLVLDAQKVGGVRGCGVLIRSPRAPLMPMTEGGGQEGGMRSGTETPGLASAFATALEEVDAAHASFIDRSKQMRTAFLQRITDLPRVVVNEGKETAPHILNLSFLGRDTDYLQALMDEAGIAVSTRSACETEPEAGSVKGSRGVLALTQDSARAETTLRISWGRGTKLHELERCARALITNVRFLDQNRLQ